MAAPNMVGKYELLRHLATGGMAEIHLARAKGIEGFEKLVVIKKLLPHGEHDKSLISMFLDEARIAATLHHPNIVQVYDIGIEKGEYFFSMEFVYGQDLSHLLRRAAMQRRQPTLDQALTIIIGLCAGLHYAHDKEGANGKPLNLVHRDVSPQNVLLSYDGAVKLMDFGIAKVASSSQKTRDGTLKGKISYMSPEQATSSDIDRRSDVFSLATMLWELTTFKRLFKAESDFESLRRIIQEDAPPPTKFRPAYPPALERIVMKGLRRNVKERYQTLEEMQLDLEEFARDQKLVISPVTVSRYMKEMFADRVSAWTKAQAEGKTFAEYLVSSPLMEDIKKGTADSWVAPITPPVGVPTVDSNDAIVPGADDDDLDISVSAVDAPKRSRRRWPLALVTLAALGAGGFFFWQRSSSEAGHDESQASAPVPAAAPSHDPTPAAAPTPPAPPPETAVAKPVEPATGSDTAAVETKTAGVQATTTGSADATPVTKHPAKTPGKAVAGTKHVGVTKPKGPGTKPASGKPDEDLDSPYY